MNIKGIATQMYVWGQVYGREGKSVDEHLDEIFGYLADAGYDGVEGGLGWTPTKERADHVHQLLEKHGLRLPSLYHGGVYHEKNEAEKTIEDTLKLARIAVEIGCPAVNVTFRASAIRRVSIRPARSFPPSRSSRLPPEKRSATGGA